MIKRFISIFMIATMLFCLVSCGKKASDDTSSEFEAEDTYYEETTDEEEITKEIEETYFWNVFESDRQNPEAKVYICDATSFLNGLAWIVIEEHNGEMFGGLQRYPYLINANGNVIYKGKTCSYDFMDGWESHEYLTNSVFINGICHLHDADKSIDCCINTKGEIVDPPYNMDKGYIKAAGEKIFGVGNLDKYYFDEPDEYGRCRITYKIDSYEETGQYQGLMSADGSWLVEPEQGKRLTIELKDDIYEVSYNKWGGLRRYYINAKTEEFTLDYGHNPEKHGYTAIDIKTGAVALDNDWKIEHEISAQVDSWELDLYLDEHDGLKYEYNKYDYDTVRNGFINNNNDVVIDLSKYIINDYDHREEPTFYNGYCVLQLRNKDGGEYFTVIDTQGNELFDPVKMPETTMEYELWGKVSSDIIWFKGATQFIDLKGQFIGKEYAEIHPYSDGLALVKEKGDTDGTWSTCNFIDTNGNDAFPNEKDTSLIQTTTSDITEEKNYTFIKNFTIEGKWKSTGSYGFGQAQPGAIVVFDGANCNLYSPRDTYAFYADGDHYVLDATSVLSGTVSFKVYTIDKNHIDLICGGQTTELERIN